MKTRKTKREVIYVNIQGNWRKFGPLFKSKDARSIWVPNMTEYMNQRTNGRFEYDPKRYPLPCCFDSCDWRYHDQPQGRPPKFWDYVCHSACHWLADLCLYVAMSSAPSFPWRIITSCKHTSVWNGSLEYPMLFDANFLALKVNPEEAWELLHGRGSVTMPPWCWHKGYNIPKKLGGEA